MSVTSYAQNFEDIILWRALKHITSGTYIDLGAQHPVVDSVSKLFYEHGWRGVHVEATPAYASLLRQDRPDETVIEAAVSTKPGVLTFFEFPDTGISTGDPEIARAHEARGFSLRTINVPTVTLADVLRLAQSNDVHWLKIDVEGMEREVLESWHASDLNPWIVVVESTLPMTQIDSHMQWEEILLDRGYLHAYFDGLNRFYVSREHPELVDSFGPGPNVFDDFELSGLASAAYCRRVHDEQLGQRLAVEQQLTLAHQTFLQERQDLEGAIADLTARLSGSEDGARALKDEIVRLTGHYAALVTQAQEETRKSLQALAEREHVFSTQLSTLSTELHQLQATSIERERSMHQAMLEQVEKSRDSLVALRRESEQRELALASSAAKRELELSEAAAINLQRAQHEAKLQLEASVARERALALEAGLLRSQMAVSETASGERERTLHGRIEALQHTLVQREQDFGVRLEATRQRAELTLAEVQQRMLDDLSRERREAESLRHTLQQVEKSLTLTHATLSWRWTAPFRAVSGLLRWGVPESSPIAISSPTSLLPTQQAPSWQTASIIVENTMMQTKFTSDRYAHAAHSLDELLGLHDEAFVFSAYRTLLGRAPDPHGLSYYLRRVRAGQSKVHLLAQMFTSAECQKRIGVNPRLAAATKSVRWLAWPLVGRLALTIGRWADHSESKNRMRAIENQVNVLAERQVELVSRLQGVTPAGEDHAGGERLALIEQQLSSLVTQLHQLSETNKAMASEMKALSGSVQKIKR